MASNATTIFDDNITTEDPPMLQMKALKHGMTSLAKVACNLEKDLSILSLEGFIKTAKKAKANPTKTYHRRRHQGEAYR